jgi:hypothetical protein
MESQPEETPDTESDPLLDLIERLDNLLADLNGQYRLEKELFQEAENYIYFAKSAPMIWYMLRDALVDSIFMSIARLLDPATSLRKDNPCFAQVIKSIPPGSDRDALEQEYSKIRKSYDSALRHWRNRKLSHNDLLTLKGEAKLPALSVAEVSELIDEINRLGRKMGHLIQGIDKSFVPAISNDSWVWRLIEMLKKATKE